MRALVLNLDTAHERLAFQERQLAALGIEWERLAAITPDTLSQPPGDPWWLGWERPLRDTEKAALETHRRAWTRVVAAGMPLLILEDDALLAMAAPDLLRMVEGRSDIDHLSLETRGRKKLLGPALDDLPVRRLWLDRSGAAAYVLWPSGARILLARTARAPALADSAICAAFALRSFQAVPALAIQADMAARHGFTPPFPVQSSIDAEARPDRRAGPGFRSRRIVAQLRMGARQLRFLGQGRRELVMPAPLWAQSGVGGQHDGKAHEQGQSERLFLYCPPQPGVPEALQNAACQALRQELARLRGQRPERHDRAVFLAENGLHIRLHLAIKGRHSVSGRLEWQRVADGKAEDMQRGPELEGATTDRETNETSLIHLGKALARHGGLPR